MQLVYAGESINMCIANVQARRGPKHRNNVHRFPESSWWVYFAIRRRTASDIVETRERYLIAAQPEIDSK
jgi:hypothetical protein